MTAAIILAAGGSSRLGFPKQTLLYKGNTLLEIAIEAGRKAKCNPVMVVLGANAEAIEPRIKDKNIVIIHNPDWADGMGSSIGVAIKHLEKIKEVNSVIIMLCDQPFVNRTLINGLIYKQQQTGSKIIACTYIDSIGVPALFDRSLFTELLLLQGHEGAKQVILANANLVSTMPFKNGGVDIDTISDYENLIKNT